MLVQNLSYLTCTYGTSAFTDRKTEAFLHSDGVEQLNLKGYVVARHYHFYSVWQVNVTGNVCGTEVELWAVTVEEWRVTATFVLAKNVYLTLEVFVMLYRN